MYTDLYNNAGHSNNERQKRIRRSKNERKMIRRRIDLFWTQLRALEARYNSRDGGGDGDGPRQINGTTTENHHRVAADLTTIMPPSSAVPETHSLPLASSASTTATAITAATVPHSASHVSHRKDGAAATKVTDQSSSENEPSTGGQKARHHAIANVVDVELDDEFPEDDCDDEEGTIPAEALLVNLDMFEVPDLETLNKEENDTSMMLKEDREMNRNDSGLTMFSQTRTKRPASTVVFRKRVCDDTELGKYVRTRLARWEPFWKIEAVLSEGITSPVASTSPYAATTIRTATDIEFLITRRTLGEKYQEFMDTLSKESSVEDKDLDLDLILWMLPVIRPKSDKADCHLWPKGTFLQLNGKPTWLQQRYEHTTNQWKGTCAPLRLARHVTKNAIKEIQRIQVVSADDNTFLFVVALCRYHSMFDCMFP
jgi:hypothetical protein